MISKKKTPLRRFTRVKRYVRSERTKYKRLMRSFSVQRVLSCKHMCTVVAVDDQHEATVKYLTEVHHNHASKRRPKYQVSDIIMDVDSMEKRRSEEHLLSLGLGLGLSPQMIAKL